MKYEDIAVYLWIIYMVNLFRVTISYILAQRSYLNFSDFLDRVQYAKGTASIGSAQPLCCTQQES